MIRLYPMACVACFGDPNSLLSKGALAGTLLLLGVILFVLGAIASTAFTWAKRAKALSEK